MSLSIKIIIALVILVPASISGYLFYENYQASAWKLYINNLYYYRITYPPTWEASVEQGPKDNPKLAQIINFTRPKDPSQTVNYPPATIAITAYPNPKNYAVSDWFANKSPDFAIPDSLNNYEHVPAVVLDREALRIASPPGTTGQLLYYFIDDDNYVLVVSLTQSVFDPGPFPSDILQTMLNSLRLGKTSPLWQPNL